MLAMRMKDSIMFRLLVKRRFILPMIALLSLWYFGKDTKEMDTREDLANWTRNHITQSYSSEKKQSKRISMDISLIRNYSGRIHEHLDKMYNIKNMSAVTMVIPKANVNGTLPKCPETPPNLVGPLKTYQNPPSFEKMELELDYLNPGGHYVPFDCLSNQRVAIVIPYRNRPFHLQTVLYNLHHMLPRQQLDYGIFVIEQAGNNIFNRGLLMNIGYVEALRTYNFTCFVFHDVDLIPEDDRIYYGCGTRPRHLSAAIDKFQYRLPYPSIAGGVTQLRRTDFEKINGFSNLFFGWGGEDDDLSFRMKAASLKIQRYSMTISRYKMIKHQREKSNPANSNRMNLLKNSGSRMKMDGLNSLKYHVLKTTQGKLYTNVKVEVNQTEYGIKM